jgi:GPH family glycoside/pentoside/hexuronide:cation symporter
LKLGVGIGSWASGEILSQTGFDATLGGNQTPHAIFTMRLLFAVIPVVGSVMALIFLIRFPLTPSRMEEIRVQLEARRGQV